MAEPGSEEIPARVVAAELESLGLAVKVDAEWAGQRLDILARTPGGLDIAVECKRWRDPTDAMLEKAAKQADLLLETGNVAEALIIIPSLPDDRQREHVRNLKGLRSAVEDLVSLKPDFGIRGLAPEADPTSEATTYLRRIFVAMPFAARFEDTYYLGILPAAEKASALCDRVDENYLSEKILDRIHAGIAGADLVIADLSGSNPNVTYELGFAHALKKPAVHLSSTPPEQLPFDLRQWFMISYDLGQVYRLRTQLEATLLKAFASLKLPLGGD